MARTIWRVTETGLIPTDEESWEALRSFKVGQEVMAEPKGARNPKQLRLFWALCSIVAENDENYDTKDKARQGIMRALHCVDSFLDRDGNLHVWAKSIAFESMPQVEFSNFLTDAINVICRWTGNQPKEVRDQIHQMVADKRYEPR